VKYFLIIFRFVFLALSLAEIIECQF